LLRMTFDGSGVCAVRLFSCLLCSCIY
jgi:hypothetical protein